MGTRSQILPNLGVLIRRGATVPPNGSQLDVTFYSGAETEGRNAVSSAHQNRLLRLLTTITAFHRVGSPPSYIANRIQSLKPAAADLQLSPCL